MVDMRDLIRLTYETEGDRLEVLLVYERIENFLARGKAIKRGDDGVLPNVDALIRSQLKLQDGVTISKVCAWTHHVRARLTHAVHATVVLCWVWDVQGQDHWAPPSSL